ncbi:hypothetical protein CHARACLAT_023247 [Characodon lateralis]|uniref:C2 domain-containing protein n=1 Tax=Characodon lateralis TaxID=208331 RepID=A0ABU7DXI1_9TELE|nr:hypothetical protein [Characodon lateralis]
MLLPTVNPKPPSQEVAGETEPMQQFAPDDSEKLPEPIVPPAWTIGSVSWEIEELVSRALRTEPDPGNEPTNCTYVPAAHSTASWQPKLPGEESQHGTDHYVIINLHLDRKIIDTKETKVASSPNPIWNAPFLFDLPPGDITQLPLALEFIVMQGRLYTKNSILGRVLIGSDALDAGREHWREICCLGQTETTRWHTIQSDTV